MGERDKVWEYGDNLFFGFKCKYCFKEFRRGEATKVEGAFGGEMWKYFRVQ
jgi:hypothetical protein